MQKKKKVGDTSLHFQTLILLLIVIIQWDFCLRTASAPHRDLIIISLSEWHEETKQTETDSIQKNCGNVSKTLQETYLQSYQYW